VEYQDAENLLRRSFLTKKRPPWSVEPPTRRLRRLVCPLCTLKIREKFRTMNDCSHISLNGLKSGRGPNPEQETHVDSE